MLSWSYNGATDTYKPIGKSWTKYVKKCFFGNLFWTVPFWQFASFIYSLIALLDIPKNRFIDLVQLLCF